MPSNSWRRGNFELKHLATTAERKSWVHRVTGGSSAARNWTLDLRAVPRDLLPTVDRLEDLEPLSYDTIPVFVDPNEDASQTLIQFDLPLKSSPEEEDAYEISGAIDSEGNLLYVEEGYSCGLREAGVLQAFVGESENVLDALHKGAKFSDDPDFNRLAVRFESFMWLVQRGQLSENLTR